MLEGQQLPESTHGPISRATLALFAGASHDHVLLHIDSDFARSAGMDDVFGHGMLTMAYAAQALRRWVPQERIRRWNARFTAITPVGAILHCRGTVAELIAGDHETLARLAIGVWTDSGLEVLKGEAIVASAIP